MFGPESEETVEEDVSSSVEDVDAAFAAAIEPIFSIETTIAEEQAFDTSDSSDPGAEAGFW